MFDILLNEEEKEIKYKTREFVKSIPPSLLRKMDREEIHYPTDYVKSLAKEELLGVRFPSEYGGQGLGWVAETAALEEIGVLGPSLGCLYSLISIVGEAINYFGNPIQKKKYLEPIIRGKLFCAEALTEPRGGSDFFGATCFAEKQGDVFILNGEKRFVVGSEGADIFLVYAKTDSEASDPRKSISTFVVERGAGVEVKHVYGLMGSRGGGTGRLNFNNVEVPEENLIGELNQGGEIFNQMMIPERMTSAAGAIGAARAGIEVAAKYSNRRKAFGQIIRKFQGVSFKIADSITLLDAARSLIFSTSRTIDANGGITNGVIRRMVSESKKFATDAAWEVINHAMQIMGGIGYTNVYPVERLLRDIRLMSIWTGTNEIMNLLIQHEYYTEFLNQEITPRDVEQDAVGAEFSEEKVFE
ncbi:MAG: acyl-CoA/acyl-ACP dehydrogenase [Candidatus Heimdallarchaeota archaeon]|nr:MAG: acyl-CoA/acyl-ACP dehydrogenase [Candidatus Heimdallarchaeota archaeon]